MKAATWVTLGLLLTGCSARYVEPAISLGHPASAEAPSAARSPRSHTLSTRVESASDAVHGHGDTAEMNGPAQPHAAGAAEHDRGEKRDEEAASAGPVYACPMHRGHLESARRALPQVRHGARGAVGSGGGAMRPALLTGALTVASLSGPGGHSHDGHGGGDHK